MAENQGTSHPRRNGWTHPVHARGVRSPRFDVRGGELLSDDRIDHYARLGYYGEAERQRVLEEDRQKAALKNKKRPKRTKKQEFNVDLALKALGL